MSDLVNGLRRLPEPQCRPCHAAADEIERLRRLVSLQDNEIVTLRNREAAVLVACDRLEDRLVVSSRLIDSFLLTAHEREAVAYYIGTGGPDAVDTTLRSLLERTK